jgi:hypothetical protein
MMQAANDVTIRGDALAKAIRSRLPRTPQSGTDTLLRGAGGWHNDPHVAGIVTRGDCRNAISIATPCAVRATALKSASMPESSDDPAHSKTVAPNISTKVRSGNIGAILSFAAMARANAAEDASQHWSAILKYLSGL